MKYLFTVIVATILTGCATSTPRSPDKINPLVKANCPKLTPLVDDSFGATTLKLVEVAGIYYRCREAALSTQPAPQEAKDDKQSKR